MKEIGLSIAGLGLLYLTRRKLTADLARLVGRFGGKQRAFVWLWSVIFLPGTIIHEMSHLFAAAITGTKIGKVEIFPELPRSGIGAQFDQQKKSVHLGYVQTQELGLFRGFIVGSAPFLMGLGLLVWLASTIKITVLIASLDPSTSLGMTERILPFLQLYLFFTVANSLFLSWVDFKHALPLVIIVVILGAIFYAIGIQPILTPDSVIFEIISRLKTALWLSVGVNIVATGLIWGVNKMRLPRRETPRNDRL